MSQRLSASTLLEAAEHRLTLASGSNPAMLVLCTC